jgi:hypothetical protein
MCAWVTGPLLQNDETHDPLNPRGGVLMVPPHSDLASRRDYSTIRIKYPMDFDPKNDALHRAQLLKDCREYPHDTGTTVGTTRTYNWQLGSSETNNNFTIDGARVDGPDEKTKSTTVFRVYDFLTTPNPEIDFPTALADSLAVFPTHGRTSCP